MIGRRRTGEENRIAITPQSNSGGSPCRPRSAPTTPTRSCCPRTCATGCPRKTWPFRSRTLVAARPRPESLLRPLRGRRAPQPPLRTGADGQAAPLRLRQRDLLLAPDRRARPAARHRLPLPGGRQYARAPHHLRVPAASPGGLCEPVRAGGKDRPRDGPGQFRDPGPRRQQGEGLSLPAQGDVIRPHAFGREAAARGDSRAAGAGRGRRPGRGCKSTASRPGATRSRRNSNAAATACKP